MSLVEFSEKCHFPGDMAVRMRKVLARPWVGVRVCHMLLLLLREIIGFSVAPTYVNSKVNDQTILVTITVGCEITSPVIKVPLKRNFRILFY